ncbi:hypothetical protein SAPIO_CDS7641 [Scedosporium apiospermum]|uniref:HIG1 domain-containing protein n=1 Tax=Pseudallescheria apiosperma TaxID=563466 RepID=A0A084G2C4_PSEDA|nr:uncharacterized protein SAPIO_CDS7641 [Scedosporium apiospermum]KEZ41486.1 hypothetical protein SAPIO_CDS7641 [Scedosporium apiospermum]
MGDKGYPSSSLPSSFDDNDKFVNENGWRKIARKIREEPLIPIGTALTIYAFINSYRAVRRGDSHGAQRMFRARVMAQGFTVLAICAGGLYYGQDRARSKELRKLKEAQDSEEKRAKWIKELEARDEEDKAMRRKLAEKRQLLEEEKQKLLEDERAAVAAASHTPKNEGGVLSALSGMWGGKKGGDAPAEGKEMPTEETAAAAAGTAQEADGSGKKKRNPRSSLDSLGEIIGHKKSSSSDSSENK